MAGFAGRIAFAILIAAAAAQPAAAAPEALKAVRDAAAGTYGKLTAEITTSTRGFVAATSAQDIYFAEAAKLADRKARAPAIRNFAARLLADTRASQSELRKLLHDYNVDAAPASGLDFRRRGLLSDLRGSRDFDRLYVAQQATAADEQRILLRRYIGGGRITAVKDYAARRLRRMDDLLAALRRLPRG
jgi:putative membrane protein